MPLAQSGQVAISGFESDETDVELVSEEPDECLGNSLFLIDFLLVDCVKKTQMCMRNSYQIQVRVHVYISTFM